MTPRDFVYWLQGYLEIEDPDKLNKEQTQIVKDHLKLVFEKKTPDYIPHQRWQMTEIQDGYNNPIQRTNWLGDDYPPASC